MDLLYLLLNKELQTGLDLRTPLEKRVNSITGNTNKRPSLFVGAGAIRLRQLPLEWGPTV